MVQDEYNRKKHPTRIDQKNVFSFSKAFFGLGVTALAILIGCKSQPMKVDGGVPSPTVLPAPKDYSPPLAQPLTTLGENFDGHFSPDGKHILFLSSTRPSHSQVQVYEKDLVSGRERRVTFQDGDNSSPHYDLKGQKVYYASTTDELKENPVFLQRQFQSGSEADSSKKNLWDMLPTDIYSSGLNGDNIQRLTNLRGFDGDLAIHPKTGNIYFSSARSGHLQIYVLDPKNRTTRLISKNPAMNEVEVAISPDGKSLAWVQYAEDLKSSQILLGTLKGEQTLILTQGPYLHLSPTFSPGGEDILFSANRESVDNFELYVIKKDGSCLRRLSFDKAQESKPSLSPDGTKILFTSNRTGTSQLYLMPYQAPSTCTPGQ